MVSPCVLLASASCAFVWLCVSGWLVGGFVCWLVVVADGCGCLLLRCGCVLVFGGGGVCVCVFLCVDVCLVGGACLCVCVFV